MYIIYRIIFPYFSIVRHTKGQLDLAKSKAELHVSINMHSFFMERKNEQAKSIFRQSAILLARDNSKIFCVNWAHKKRLCNSYQQFSIFKNFRYSFVRFPLNQLKRIIRSKSMFWIEKLICIYILQNRAQNNFSCQHFSVDIIWKVWWHTHFIFYKSLVQELTQ